MTDETFACAIELRADDGSPGRLVGRLMRYGDGGPAGPGDLRTRRADVAIERHPDR